MFASILTCAVQTVYGLQMFYHNSDRAFALCVYFRASSGFCDAWMFSRILDIGW